MDALGVALVGGLVGGAVAALIAGYVTLEAQKRDHRTRATEAIEGRKHERAMAREARLQERRARAYERALEHAYRLGTWVERTEPFFGPVPDPPTPLPDAEMWSLNATIAAHASPTAQELALTMSKIAREFQVAVWRRQRERDTGIEDQLEPRPMIAITELRDAYHESVRTLGARLAAELRGETD